MGATDEQIGAVREDLEALPGFCQAQRAVMVVCPADRVQAMVDASTDADLAIVGTSAHHLVYDVLFGTVPDRLVERLDCTVLLTHSGRPRRLTFLRAIIERLVF